MDDIISMDWVLGAGGGGQGGVVQEVMQAMGSDGEQHMKLLLLTHCSLPTVQPGS